MRAGARLARGVAMLPSPPVPPYPGALCRIPLRPVMSRSPVVSGAGEVRIIAGRFRGRRLRFPAAPGLRPTGDRLRETLFNWLQPHLPGARVLDLFAGSGALGFEAASRGAASVLMVELAKPVFRALSDNCRLIGADNVALVNADARSLLARETQAFDLIFLDPPFHHDWLPTLLSQIAERQLLAEGGLIYLENEAAAGAPALPDGWVWHREKVAGAVRYALARRPRADEAGADEAETDTTETDATETDTADPAPAETSGH